MFIRCVCYWGVLLTAHVAAGGEEPATLPQDVSRDEANSHGVRAVADRTRLIVQPVPRGYRIESDLPYAGTGNPRQTLDLYLPVTASPSPRPLLVFVHGGAWRGGDKRSGLRQLRPFLRGEYVGASLGYRLSDEAIWPAQIHDCKAAIRWLKAHAETYDFDPDRVAVYGTSAGGHLVAMLGTTGGVESLEGNLGAHADQDSRVAAVIDFFGPSDLLSMGRSPAIDHEAADSPESQLVGGKLAKHEDRARSASPTTYVTADDADHLIVHGDQDRLVPFQQSQLLHSRLRRAGVTSFFIRMAGGGHGFRHVELERRMKQFLDRSFDDANDVVSEKPIRVVPQ